MKRSNEYHQLNKHSFLFWLVIPFMFIWLAISYVRVEISRVKGVQTSVPAQTIAEAVPFIKEYSLIESSNTGYLTLWFDDAWLSQYTIAAPLLKKYGYPAAIAVPTAAVGSKSYINWPQLRVMQKEGWEVTNHSSGHDCEMQNWDAEKIRDDLKKSKGELWRNKLTSDHFVSPCGVISDALKNEVKGSFLSFRSVESGFNDPANIDPYHLKIQNINKDTTLEVMNGWIQQAKKDKTWLIIVFHKVGEEDSTDDETYNIKQEDFVRLLEEIKVSGIKVVLPSQMLKKI